MFDVHISIVGGDLKKLRPYFGRLRIIQVKTIEKKFRPRTLEETGT